MAKRKVLESRRTERVQVSWRIHILLPKEQSVEGRIYDVSAGGILFASPYKYKRGDRIALDIIIGPRQFIRTRIFVLRQAARQDGMWVYGAKLVNLTGIDRMQFEEGLKNADPIPAGSRSQSAQLSIARLGIGDLVARFRRSKP